MTSLEYLVNDLPPGVKELKKVKLQWRSCRYLQEILNIKIFEEPDKMREMSGY